MKSIRILIFSIFTFLLAINYSYAQESHPVDPIDKCVKDAKDKDSRAVKEVLGENPARDRAHRDRCILDKARGKSRGSKSRGGKSRGSKSSYREDRKN